MVPPPGAVLHGDTVEWIMECPGGGEPSSALPYFTPVEFTSALACAWDNGGFTGLTAPQNGDILNIENPSNNRTLTQTTPGQNTVTIVFIG
jgi:hypothetical protein